MEQQEGEAHPQPPPFFALSCPSRSECWASIGGGLVRTTDGGRQWRTQNLPAALGLVGLGGISCPSVSTCLLAAYGAHRPFIVATTDHGQHWKAGTLPGGLESLAGPISCAGPSHCTALSILDEGNGTGALATDNGGRTWTTQKLELGGSAFLSDISCPTAMTCVTATDSPNPAFFGSIGVTGDGGKVWTTTTAIPIDSYGVACADAGRCWVVGANLAFTDGLVEATVNGGKNWTAETLPAATPVLESISCANASDCTAVGHDVAVTTTDGGANWSSAALPSGIMDLEGVSCPAPSACQAVGYTTGDAVIVGPQSRSVPK